MARSVYGVRILGSAGRRFSDAGSQKGFDWCAELRGRGGGGGGKGLLGGGGSSLDRNHPLRFWSIFLACWVVGISVSKAWIRSHVYLCHLVCIVAFFLFLFREIEREENLSFGIASGNSIIHPYLTFISSFIPLLPSFLPSFVQATFV